ncbi:MarR family winged helix-turn-helix transcriptional regulator [Paracoccus sp. JM45]|uniref:MarR family winged helix-turn-helix transcriptional regulator n=1 Tax=Paracoccus sp. JM45 TaxID=2283626 RepID=UPI000E6C33C9|nr:MarR family transcriptional regulator [Paracoccus sp. JM45]RJE81432.1 MarR family transcriptional regulator [Paracoccus sp. JM45]
MDSDPLLARLLSSDLKELSSITHIVLSNNQVTNRYIERRYGMPVQCWSALYAITSFPGLRARDVMRVFPRPQNTISRAVSLLEQRGLITQRPSVEDGRAKQLFPTDAGQQLNDEIRATIQKRQAEIFCVLSDDEQATLLALCQKVVANPGLYQSGAMPDAD